MKMKMKGKKSEKKVNKFQQLRNKHLANGEDEARLMKWKNSEVIAVEIPV